jgi:HK97 family phage major capsid protein
MPAQLIGRSDLAPQMIPDQEVTEILKMAPQQSVMLSRAKRVVMSSKKYKQPVLNTLPAAYWVNGDTGLKQTTKADWAGLSITAEELAAIVVIPDSVVEDSKINLWGEVRPLIAEAIGLKVDGAAIFDVDKPDSWPDGIVTAATDAGNVVQRGTGRDLGVDVANLGAKIAKQGYGVNGFVSKPGMQWELVGLRDGNGQPVYTALAGGTAHGLYGYELNEVMNGSWDDEKAELIALDWSKQLIGIRRDVTYEIFSEGVISDDDGKVLLNLMQQDSKALRVTFRVGYQVAKPKTRIQGETAYPGGVITPAVTAGETDDGE